MTEAQATTGTELDELPDGWTARKFGDVVVTASGQVDPREKPYSEMLHVGPENITEGSGQLVGCRTAGDLNLISGKYLFTPDDVLYSKIRPYLRKAALPDVTGVCSADMYPLRPRTPELARDFLYAWQLSERFTSQAVSFQDRTGIPKINRQQLDSTSIVLPPVAEQRAIAGVLRAGQRAREAAEAAAGAARQLKRSLLRHLFTYGPVSPADADRVPLRDTDFGPHPADWSSVPLGECAAVQTGVAKGRKLDGEDSVNVPYLRVANVQDGYLDLAEIKNIDIRRSEVERYALQPGDVLLTEGGDFDELGRGFVWNGQIPGCVHQNHVFAVRPRRDRCYPECLAHLTQSEYGKNYFLSVAHKTTNLACINSSKLKAFPVLLPPLAEQRRMVEMIRAVDAKVGAEEARAGAAGAAFAALVRELMTGRVRVG